MSPAVTYEDFAEAWPSRTGEFADKFNGMRKYVVSSTLEDPEWSNSTVITPDALVAEVSNLREQPGGDVLVNGSVQLVQTLLRQNLVDEYWLMVFRSSSGTASACSRAGTSRRRCGSWSPSRPARRGS
jgi:dihydrofolate reductase